VARCHNLIERRDLTDGGCDWCPLQRGNKIVNCDDERAVDTVAQLCNGRRPGGPGTMGLAVPSKAPTGLWCGS
jgi:hypothetical protein